MEQGENRGRIILNLAVSLDGYIADPEGNYDFIAGQGDPQLDTAQQADFGAFLEDMDLVIMGRKSYDQGFHEDEDYKRKQIWVMTHEARADQGRIRFLGEDAVEEALKAREAGKKIYLFGGGLSIDPFIKADVIDEYHVSILPLVLGSGRRLFLEGNPKIDLHLDRYTVSDGIMGLVYSKR